MHLLGNRDDSLGMLLARLRALRGAAPLVSLTVCWHRQLIEDIAKRSERPLLLGLALKHPASHATLREILGVLREANPW